MQPGECLSVLVDLAPTLPALRAAAAATLAATTSAPPPLPAESFMRVVRVGVSLELIETLRRIHLGKRPLPPQPTAHGVPSASEDHTPAIVTSVLWEGAALSPHTRQAAFEAVAPQSLAHVFRCDWFECTYALRLHVLLAHAPPEAATATAKAASVPQPPLLPPTPSPAAPAFAALAPAETVAPGAAASPVASWLWNGGPVAAITGSPGAPQTAFEVVRFSLPVQVCFPEG